MKNHTVLSVLCFVGLLGAVLLSCEQTDVNRTFEGPYYVRFTDTTVTYKESYNKPIAIRVHNVGPVLDQAIKVRYTISGSARENRDYQIQGTKGTVVIPAGKSFGEITVKLINNANNILESQALTFTLTGVEPSSLQVGFGTNNIVGKQITFIIRDDCLLSGSYTGTQRFSGQTASVSDIEITSTDCKNYQLSNWNLGIFNFSAIRAQLLFVDNGDNSLTIPPQPNAQLAPTELVQGSGSWNPRDRRITLNLQLKLQITADKDTTVAFTQTYTPQ